MNPICDNCGSQVSDNKGGVMCGIARYYSPNPGYGGFKGGAVCRYDSDLKDLFKVREEGGQIIYNMSAQISRRKDEIHQLKYEKEELERRVISIGRGE